MATPTDQELQLLKSGDLDADREAELFLLLAGDRALQERYSAIPALTPSDRRSFHDDLLGRPSAIAVPKQTLTVIRRNWSEVVAGLVAALRAFAPSPARRLELGWRDLDGLGDEDREVPLLSSVVDFEGEPLALTVSALLTKGAGRSRHVELLVTAAKLEGLDVVPGLSVRLTCPLLTGGTAVTDTDGVARFRIIAGGRGLLEDTSGAGVELEVALSWPA